MSFLDRGVWEGRIYCGGWTAGSGGEYDAVEPATGQKLARVGAASATDVHKAAERAARAQREWAALPYDRRAEVMRRAVQLFVEHEEEIHEWLLRESGAIRPFAAFQTWAVAAEECREAAALASHPYGELLRSNQPRLSMARRQLKRVHLELGGNLALIVLDDVDLERAVSVGPMGSFNHAGQIYMATSRHLVSGKIAADYAAALAERADRLPVGDPTRDDVAMGPIIDAKQRDTIHNIVTASVDAGATLAAGGTYEGLFYRPTVLTDVPVTAPAFAEEIFGPVAPRRGVLRVGRGGPAGPPDRVRAVTRDSDPRRDEGPGPGRANPSGLVHINDQTVNGEALIPFGGSASPAMAPGPVAPRPTWTPTPTLSGSPCAATCHSTPSEVTADMPDYANRGGV